MRAPYSLRAVGMAAVVLFAACGSPDLTGEEKTPCENDAACVLICNNPRAWCATDTGECLACHDQLACDNDADCAAVCPGASNAHCSGGVCADCANLSAVDLNSAEGADMRWSNAAGAGVCLAVAEGGNLQLLEFESFSGLIASDERCLVAIHQSGHWWRGDGVSNLTLNGEAVSGAEADLDRSPKVSEGAAAFDGDTRFVVEVISSFANSTRLRVLHVYSAPRE